MQRLRSRKTVPETRRHHPIIADAEIESVYSLRKRSVPTKMLKRPLPMPVSKKKKLRPMQGMLMLEPMMIRPKNKR